MNQPYAVCSQPSPTRRLALASSWLIIAMGSLVAGEAMSTPGSPPTLQVIGGWLHVLTALSLVVIGFQVDSARRAFRAEETR